MVPMMGDMKRVSQLFMIVAAVVVGTACDAPESQGDGVSRGEEAPAKTHRGQPSKADGAVAPGWDCNGSYFDSDDGCDCGCGVLDPDCAGQADAAACDYEWCDAAEVDDEHNWICGETDAPDGLPEAWSCKIEYYGTGDGCDCGCNAFDPDCASLSSTECDYQYCEGTDGINAHDNTSCEPHNPPADDDDGADDEPSACAGSNGCSSDSECVAGSRCSTWGFSCLKCAQIFCTSNASCPEGSRCAGYGGHSCVPD